MLPSPSPCLRQKLSTVPECVCVSWVFVGRTTEEKPFMVLRLIRTSYKGLISIYSYDTHKTGITFKLMLSSCRFTFIFGNPTFSERSVALVSACRHKFSLIFFFFRRKSFATLAYRRRRRHVEERAEWKKWQNFLLLKMASKEINPPRYFAKRESEEGLCGWMRKVATVEKLCDETFGLKWFRQKVEVDVVKVVGGRKGKKVLCLMLLLKDAMSCFGKLFREC